MKRVFVILFILALGGFQFGYNAAVISGVILLASKTFALSLTEQGWAMGMLFLGAALGGYGSGFLADWRGRRGSLFWAASFFVLGGVLGYSATSFPLFLLARFFQGVGVGLVSLLVPLYIAEWAEPHKRGQYSTLNQVAIALGMLVAYGANIHFTPSSDWRSMMGIGAFLGLAHWLFLWVIPVLQRKVAEKKKRVSFFSLLSLSSYRRPLIMGILAALFQQTVGISAILYFAPTVFMHAQIGSSTLALKGSLAVGVVSVVMTFLCAYLVDRFGRKPLLLWSLAGIFVSLSSIALSFCLTPSFLPWLVVSFFMLYIAFFSLGLGPLPWLLISEIFPEEIRAKGMAISTASNWIANYLVSFSFLGCVHLFSMEGTFFLYALIAFFGFLLVYKKMVETKGKSIEDIKV